MTRIIMILTLSVIAFAAVEVTSEPQAQCVYCYTGVCQSRAQCGSCSCISRNGSTGYCVPSMKLLPQGYEVLP